MLYLQLKPPLLKTLMSKHKFIYNFIYIILKRICNANVRGQLQFPANSPQNDVAMPTNSIKVQTISKGNSQEIELMTEEYLYWKMHFSFQTDSFYNIYIGKCLCFIWKVLATFPCFSHGIMYSLPRLFFV